MIFQRMLGSQGMTFGAMDGVITVLGVLAGLFVLGDRAVLIAGMLIAGLADSMANGIGIHVSMETEGEHSRQEVLASTFMAFLATAIVTVLLTIPVFLLPVETAVIVTIALGFLLILGVGFFVGMKLEKTTHMTSRIMLEYLAMAVVVIVLANGIGILVKSALGVI